MLLASIAIACVGLLVSAGKDDVLVENGYTDVTQAMFSVQAGVTIKVTVDFTVAQAKLINGTAFGEFEEGVKGEMSEKCYGEAQQYAVAQQTGIVASALTGCVFKDNVTAYMSSSTREVKSWALDGTKHKPYWAALEQAEMRAGVFKGKVGCSGTQPYSVEVTVRMGVTSVVYNGRRHIFPNVDQFVCMQSDGSTDGVSTDSVEMKLEWIEAAPTPAPGKPATPAPGKPTTPAPGKPTPAPPGGDGGSHVGPYVAVALAVMAAVGVVGFVVYKRKRASTAGYEEV